MFTLLCSKFIQYTLYQILSELVKSYRRCDKNTSVFFTIHTVLTDKSAVCLNQAEHLLFQVLQPFQQRAARLPAHLLVYCNIVHKHTNQHVSYTAINFSFQGHKSKVKLAHFQSTCRTN